MLIFGKILSMWHVNLVFIDLTPLKLYVNSYSIFFPHTTFLYNINDVEQFKYHTFHRRLFFNEFKKRRNFEAFTFYTFFIHGKTIYKSIFFFQMQEFIDKSCFWQHTILALKNFSLNCFLFVEYFWDWFCFVFFWSNE